MHLETDQKRGCAAMDSDTDDEPGSPRIKKSRCRCTEDSGEDKSAFNEPPPAASASDDTCMHTDEDDGPHKDDASLLQFVCSMSSLGVNPYLLELQKNQHHLLWDIDDFVWKLTNANSFSEQPGKHPLMAPQDLNLAIIPFQETKLGLEDVVAKLTDYKDARGELEAELAFTVYYKSPGVCLAAWHAVDLTSAEYKDKLGRTSWESRAEDINLVVSRMNEAIAELKRNISALEDLNEYMQEARKPDTAPVWEDYPMVDSPELGYDPPRTPHKRAEADDVLTSSGLMTPPVAPMKIAPPPPVFRALPPKFSLTANLAGDDLDSSTESMVDTPPTPTPASKTTIKVYDTQEGGNEVWRLKRQVPLGKIMRKFRSERWLAGEDVGPEDVIFMYKGERIRYGDTVESLRLPQNAVVLASINKTVAETTER